MRIVKLACVAFLIAGCALAQPAVFDGGVLNGASFVKGQAVAPGSVVSIFGSGLATAVIPGDTVPLSTNIGGTTVAIDGIQAPLYFVADGQINAQLPWNLPMGNASIVVNSPSGTSAPINFQVAGSAPGVFSIPNGVGWAVAINNADGSIAAPPGAIAGINTHPAKAGDAIILYANGLGAVNSAPPNGWNSTDQLRSTLSAPTVMVGGVQAQVIFSGLTPQFPGINQVNFIVPGGVTGTVPLQLSLGGITTTNQVTIAIQ